MLYGMSTIEIIENLIIEIWPKIGWYDGSDDRRRYAINAVSFNYLRYGAITTL